MYLNYAKIKNGQKKQPQLRLRTLAGKELGVIPYVHNLTFSINYSDLSTIEFTVPYYVNGMINPLYSALTSYKVIYTEELGIYILVSPQKSGDGVQETKTVRGYSLEQQFQGKMLFLEEGTYNFWNPVNSADTVLGRIVELDPSWHIGYVSPRLIGCYRTFDEYDSDALSFCYGDAMEKYSCVFVFDVYEKSISVYDATMEADTLPIYLSYENLVKAVDIEEITDDLTTKLHLYGSDNLSIRSVNPTGTDYIVNLDFFLSNGDLDVRVGNSNVTLADRVRSWQVQIAAKQTYYSGLVAARSSLTAQKLVMDAELTELNGELDSLTAQQSVTIQAIALEKTSQGKNTQQAKLNEINSQITAKNNEIANQESRIKTLEKDIASYNTSISAVNKELGYNYYFTDAERKILNQYLIEGDMEDETFVATDIDTSASAAVSKVSGNIAVSGSSLYRVSLTDFNKMMYMITGGKLTLANAGITAEIVRGTLEVNRGNAYVLTCYLGTTSYNGRNFSRGLITISGWLSQFSSDISLNSDHEVSEYKGTRFSFQTTNADTYFTVNTSDFQKYSVEMELYDFGMDVLDDYAWPVYEFSVDSANFLYHDKFEPFKNKLELGKAVHLQMGSDGLLSAKIIGVELNFDDISSFNLLFSNRYQLKDGEHSVKELTNTVSRSSRSINASKYTYNRSAERLTEVEEIMQQQLVAAVQNIVNKEDQTVLINGSGINIGGKSNYQMRLVDNMIAMTDDGWKTAKLAIGLFATEAVGTQWGVNAEMLAGNVMIGNKLILQNVNDDGYMMFQVDSTGAWLYNAQFVLQDEKTGGLIIADPKYGIVGGTKLLFDTNGTRVTPEFMDNTGEITYDSDGMPKNANFYLDIKNGNAYFRGKLIAQSGKIGGYTIENGYLHSGSSSNYVALNGGTDVYSLFAIWAGNANPNNAPFWVKKNGDFHAKNGDFSGTLSAAKLSGALTALDGAEIIGPAIYVPNKSNPKFKVDSAGNVSMTGNLTLSSGAITWNNLSSSVRNEIYGAYAAAAAAARDAAEAASDAYEAERLARRIANGEFNNGTFINGTEIYSPTIYADEFIVKPKNTAGNSRWTGGYSMYGYFGSWLYKMLSISYVDTGFGPEVEFWSPDGAYAYWAFPRTSFHGHLDFSQAIVEGLSLDAKFG